MLVDFEVENFRSYREAKRLSMVASSAKELPQNLIETNLGLNLVRSAVLYGPNASGKSNLLAAMNWVSAFLEPTTHRLITDGIGRFPFALDRTSASKPTRFRVRFVVESVLHDYAISISPAAVEEERLVVYPHGRPQEWFHRTGKDIGFNATYLKGQKQSLRGVTPNDAPLLAVAAAFGHPQLTLPARWLARNLSERLLSFPFRIRAGSAGARGTVPEIADRCHRDESFRSWVDAFLRHADLGIQGVEIEIFTRRYSGPSTTKAPDGTMITKQEEFTENHPEPFFLHGGDDGIPVRLRLSDESQGTRRLFVMLVPLYEVLLAGEVIVADELDASLHPSLVREIVRAFHDPELNPKGAQLVFATHDTSHFPHITRRISVNFRRCPESGQMS
jgi:energy-coupling factor transporter ATP-binding protein EcfA2